MGSIFGTLFRRVKPGDPVRKACDHRNLNTLFDIAEDTQGMGCRVIRTNTGKGWLIAVDGGTDVPFPPGTEPPWAGGGGSMDFPWRVSVSGGYVTMTPGRTLDLVSGATSTHSLTSVAAADGYVYAVYQSQGNGGLSVGFGAALPTPSSGEIVLAIAHISGGAVTQYVVGLLPLVSVTAETV